ncbi:MAG: NosD domain-containing protein [Candidatus Woesearchaeota archaeon]
MPLWTNDGIEIHSTVSEFRNNSFSNFTAIWIYSSNNKIEGNSFTGFKNHGIGFMAGSNNNKIIGNYFGHAAMMNRQIIGIKFFPGTNNEEIAYNTIEWVPESITITEMPPSTPNNGFFFHDNTIRNTLQAAIVRGNHILFLNEHYSDIYAIGISVAGYYNVTIENSSFTNLAFQEELNDQINQDYFEEGTTRQLIPSIEWYMFVFYTTKSFIRPGGYGNLLVLRNNYFADTPPYGNAVVFDGGPHNNFRVYDNTFENIGNYIPNGFTVRRDYTERVNLSGRSDIPGAAISLELIKKAEIIGNTFNNVVNGILTSTPDTVGTYGDYEIRDNIFRGLGGYTWQELYSSRGNETWWDTPTTRTEGGIGVGTGTHGWLINGIDWGCTDESYWHYTYLVYIADSTQRIQQNTFSNFKYPVVIDYSRLTPCEQNVLGPKHAIITGNNFYNYTRFDLLEGVPSTIEVHDNGLYSCTDGTQEGTCSTSKPLFCREGSLINACSTCGCPLNYTCNANGVCLTSSPTTKPPTGKPRTEMDIQLN